MKNAFTLIELMIVMAIISIIAAIAVPNLMESRIVSNLSKIDSDIKSGDVYCEYKGVQWKVTRVLADNPKGLVFEDANGTNITIYRKDNTDKFDVILHEIITDKSNGKQFKVEQENIGPTALYTGKFKIGETVDHKLMTMWGGGIVSEITNGKYTVKFKVDDVLKEVDNISEGELEKGFSL